MKPVTHTWALMLLIIVALTSCKEFIEPDISDKQVKLNAPANNFQSKSYTVNFWWDETEDARNYRLQIVSPGFEQPTQLVADTLVSGNKFSLNLVPGDYEWRVRAENNGYQTAYSQPLKFQVVFSSLKQQTTTLVSPANNQLSNQANISFNWNSLYGATKYRLQVDSDNFAGATVMYEQVTPALQAGFTVPKDRSFQWRVRAENDTAQAQWSGINSITIDRTSPPVVTLANPANSAIVTSPVSLQWNVASTAVRYKLTVLKSDQTTPYNNSFPMLLTATSYSFTSGVTGDRIYWRVTAIDAAGNESAASELRSFDIQ
ncbi:hypothetical protein [Mucilaginibacter terrae]|uniref:Fibronectin type-III domain-containing protein n=1 Tax=Mucilaginibacter terrae TaxID=1955052 RepID=A0ABU3GVE6_9SPHI|nr:hypothetical protein [Mucilaginibacter terrae]MDT3403752.1 hypothetical protein [Mucilaginibacter terrae]